MDFPFLLVILLALPIAAAGIIVAVSIGRRRAVAAEVQTEPQHRLQTGTAAAQDAADHPAADPPRAESARLRRAASADRPAES